MIVLTFSHLIEKSIGTNLTQLYRIYFHAFVCVYVCVWEGERERERERENQKLKEKKYQSTYVTLTGLTLTILKAGTTKTVTAKNVKVSKPKSLMTSIALATSSAAYTRDLSLGASLCLEKQNPPQSNTVEINKGVPSKIYPETKDL
jgi:hypothetical protein